MFVAYLSDKRTKYTGSKNIVSYKKKNVFVVLYLTDNITQAFIRILMVMTLITK